MSTDLLPEADVAPGPRPATHPTVVAVVAGYVATLVMPLAAAVVLLAGWTLTSATGWRAAGFSLAAWCVVVLAWLRFRGWSSGVAHLVTWAAPAALLAPLGALGWLSADGLVLWAPVTGVLVLSLAMTARQDCPAEHADRRADRVR